MPVNERTTKKGVPGTLYEEAIDSFAAIFIGPHLGDGSFRDVYSHLTNDKWVIKVQKKEVQADFSNALEWEIWCDWRYDVTRKWIAPCVDISPDGKVLIQRKTIPFAKCTPAQQRRLPTRVPAILGRDTNLSNWGYMDGRWVCHDYSYLDYHTSTAPWTLINAKKLFLGNRGSSIYRSS